MGYITEFELLFDDQNVLDDWEDFAEELGLEDLGGEKLTKMYSAKWYNYEEDIESFLKRHPGSSIEVRGDGEEHGDVWKQRFTIEGAGRVKRMDWSF